MNWKEKRTKENFPNLLCQIENVPIDLQSVEGQRVVDKFWKENKLCLNPDEEPVAIYRNFVAWGWWGTVYMVLYKERAELDNNKEHFINSLEVTLHRYRPQGFPPYYSKEKLKKIRKGLI